MIYQSHGSYGIQFKNYICSYSRLDGGFKYYFIFTSTWGNDPIWLIHFRWVVQPPTSRTVLKFAWLLEVSGIQLDVLDRVEQRQWSHEAAMTSSNEEGIHERWWSHWYEGGSYLFVFWEKKQLLSFYLFLIQSWFTSYLWTLWWSFA